MRSGAVVRSATVVVGREVELEVLHRGVRGASAGESSCVLVVGDGGVGKSRLLGEAAAAARQRGLGVAVGRAAISAPAPFSLISEALRSWLRGHPLTPTRSPFDQGLRLVLPEWEVPGGEAGDLDAGQLRLLAYEGIVRVLRRVIEAGAGALLVLDDLHAADPESLEAFRYVASAGLDGLAVVGALRAGESALAGELVRGLRATEATTIIELEPLRTGAVADLITNLLGAATPADLVADVLSRTDGVPLLVEEVIDAYVRAGSVLVDGGSARWLGGAAVLPRSVRDMVAARLEGLPRSLRDALVAAAVAGPAGPAGLVAAVAGTDEETVSEALRRGVDAGLLSTSGGLIGFRHDIIRTAVLDDAIPQAVTAMHRRAAAALTAEPDAARRALHLAAAGDRDEAARSFVAAASGALGAHALLGAERLAGQAVEHAVTSATRAAAADALAAAFAAQGRWAEALATDEATGTDSGDTADRRHRMASAALEAGYPDRAGAVLARSDERLPLTRLLAARVALVGGDARTALTAVDAVLTEPVDVDTRLAALDIRARCLDFLGERTAAEHAWTAQAAQAAAAGRTQARLRALLQLGKQEFFAGHRPARLREAVGVAAEAGALVELAWAEETLAIALTLQGDPAAALEVLAAAIPRARELRLDQLAFLLVAQAGALSLSRDTVESLLAEAEELAPAPDLLMFTATIRADIAMRRGRYDEAIAHYLRVGELAAAMPGVAPVDSTCFLVWARAGAGQRDEAREVLRLAQALPDLARWYPRPVITEAGAAMLAGDARGVDAAIAAARGPMPFAVAILRTIGAEVLGGEVAIAWLREALDIYEATGATACRERARRLLRDAGGAVPRRRKATVAVPDALARHGVTAREAEVLRLLGDGMSNADIASKLFLSVRTVETHVSSLLVKLQTRSRGQLTALSATIAFDA